jgi:hypothetical protein
VRKITIPKVIDDYNHWMCGVDKADQLIAYYRPNLRCRRTWMPLFFHGLDVVRVNSFIACRELGWKSSSNQDPGKQHKEFLKDWIQALIKKGKTMEVQRTRARMLGVAPPASFACPTKKARISAKNPTLPDHRYRGDPRDHVRVDAQTQRLYRMCSYYYALAKLQGVDPLPRISEPRSYCFACKDHLCAKHFDEYHNRR